MQTTWQIHLANTRAECKGKVSPQEVMKIAARTYKSDTDPSKNKASCVRHKSHSRKNKKHIKKGHKGAPSITRPGHLDFVTHKGSKYYTRRGHRYRYNIEGVYGKPYQHTKKHKKAHKKQSRKAIRGMRRELGRGVASDACTARLAEVMTALGAANARLAQAQSENRRLSVANVQNLNLQGEIQSCRNQVASLERQVSDLQAQAAAAPVMNIEPELEPEPESEPKPEPEPKPAAPLKPPANSPTKPPANPPAKPPANSSAKPLANPPANPPVAEQAKGAIQQATDAMRNVASQITDAITGATSSVEAEAAAAKKKVVAEMATTGGKKSRRRRSRATRR